MFFDNYPIKLSNTTRPFSLKGLKTAPAILLIHGYTGSPREMIWLGRQLNEAGYNVFIPRLPGHGTDKDDFLASDWQDWLRVVCENYINLNVTFETVYVGGLSMGALLALLIAAKFNPDKLFMCAPAFTAYDSRVKYSPFLKFFIKKVATRKKNYDNDPEYARAIADYNGVEYLKKTADFYKIQKLALKNMGFVRSQTLTVLSKADQTVPFEVKDIIDKNLKTQNEYLILENSGHVVTNDTEKETVAKKIIEFLKD